MRYLFVLTHIQIEAPPGDPTGISTGLLALARLGAGLLIGILAAFLVIQGYLYMTTDETTRGVHLKRGLGALLGGAIIVLVAVTLAPQIISTVTGGAQPSASPGTGGNNIVQNGGMEDGWNNWNASADCSRTFSDAHSGTWAMSVLKAPWEQEAIGCSYKITLEANKTYTLSVSIKGENGFIAKNDAAHKIIHSTAKEYTLYSTTIQTGQNSEEITIILGSTGDNRVLFDDLSLH